MLCITTPASTCDFAQEHFHLWYLRTNHLEVWLHLSKQCAITSDLLKSSDSYCFVINWI